MSSSYFVVTDTYSFGEDMEKLREQAKNYRGVVVEPALVRLKKDVPIQDPMDDYPTHVLEAGQLFVQVTGEDKACRGTILHGLPFSSYYEYAEFFFAGKKNTYPELFTEIPVSENGYMGKPKNEKKKSFLELG
jgi:hypothetical protein